MGELDRRDQVDADDRFDLVALERVEATLQLEGRVVHQNVDPTQLRGRRGCDLAGSLRMGKVDRGDCHNQVVASELLREPSELVLRASDQQQVQATGGEGPGDVRPDSTRGAGQDGVARLH